MSSYELARKLLDNAGFLASSLLNDSTTSALSSALSRAAGAGLSAESTSGLLFIGVFSTFYIGSRYRVSQASSSDAINIPKEKRRDKSGLYRPPGRQQSTSLPPVVQFSDMPDVAALDSTVLSDGLSTYSDEIVDHWLSEGGLIASEDEGDDWAFKGNSSLSVRVVGWEAADANDTDGLYLIKYSYTNSTFISIPSPERATRGSARTAVSPSSSSMSSHMEMDSPSDPFGLQSMGATITSPFKVKRAQEVKCSVKKSYRDMKLFCEQLSFLSHDLQTIDYPSLEYEIGTHGSTPWVLLETVVSTLTLNLLMNMLNERMEKRRHAFDEYFIKLSAFFQTRGGQDYSLQKLCRFLDRDNKFIKL